MIIQTVILLILFISYKFTLNFFKVLKTQDLFEGFCKWIETRDINYIENKDEVINLFRAAGIKDSVLPVVEPAGYNQIYTANASFFNNFPNIRQDACDLAVICFKHATGVYRKKMWDSINPLFWIEYFLNLPKHILEFLGILPGTLIVKICQVIWWFLGIAASVLWVLIKNQIIKNLDWLMI